MDDHEIYAGKRVAGMRTEYLRHEYTWSNHCITGNTLGWGITSSSIPKDKKMLKELEKIASSLEPDRVDGIPVEELVYSPDLGFVKMIAIPCDAGEDHRNNKKIYLYQPKEKQTEDPAVYLAPDIIWNSSEGDDLDTISIEELQDSQENILIKMNLYDRLPDFFRVVFLCLFEKKQSLNIVAPSWPKEEFAARARELMYVIHRILPAPMRKKAGYVSYTEQDIQRVPFYFSSSSCGENCLNLDSFGKGTAEHTENGLEDYYFYHLAELYVKKDPLYDVYMKKAAGYLDAGSGTGNELGKLEWLFYGICQKKHRETLDKQVLLPRIPELLFWSSKDKALQSTADTMMEILHQSKWNRSEKEEYLHILLEGFTKRAQEVTCGEIKWILQSLYAESPEAGREQLAFIREKNKLVYGLLLSEEYDRKGTFASEEFENSMKYFSTMDSYVKNMEKAGIPSSMKDQVIRAGIGLLNQNLFDKERYMVFDQIIRRMKREDQWTDILKDFVGQLEEQAEEFDDEQLETACYVEEMLAGYSPKEAKGILMEERRRRKEKQLPKDIEQDAALVVPVEEEEEEGSFIDYLLGMLPQGFLTGCSMYLSIYSLMIGHWKIAVGMVGIWVILMLNYYYMMLHEEKRYPFWKNLGGCVIMGYLIQTFANMILSQKLRLYYFIILGILTVLVQVAGIFKAKMRKEEK